MFVTFAEGTAAWLETESTMVSTTCVQGRGPLCKIFSPASTTVRHRQSRWTKTVFAKVMSLSFGAIRARPTRSDGFLRCHSNRC